MAKFVIGHGVLFSLQRRGCVNAPAGLPRIKQS